MQSFDMLVYAFSARGIFRREGSHDTPLLSANGARLFAGLVDAVCIQLSSSGHFVLGRVQSLNDGLSVFTVQT